MVSINVGILKTSINPIIDALTRLGLNLENISNDEDIASDAVQIAVAIDPALMPLEIALPIGNFIVNWLAANLPPASNPPAPPPDYRER